MPSIEQTKIGPLPSDIGPGVRSPDRILAPGFAAGLAGGAVMAAWMVASALVEGVDPLAPLWPMGDTFAGSGPHSRGAGALLYGLALHLAWSGAVGVVFTALLPRAHEPRFAAVMSVGFAFGAMALMTSFVLPAVNPSLREEMSELGGAWVLAHAAYGATVGYAAQRLRQRAAATIRRPAPDRASGARRYAGRPG